MATKNLKKVIRKIVLNSKEKDMTKRSFNPMAYPTNWNKSIKYLNAKYKRATFNAIFRPLFADIYRTDIQEYLAGGHKLNAALKKGMKQHAKEKAIEITKAKLALKAAAKQSGAEQEAVQPQES